MSKTKTSNKSSKQKNSLMAAVAYIIFFIPLLTDTKKDSFVIFHVKQGLVLAIIGVILFIINAVLPWYWYSIGWVLSLLSLGLAVLAVLGIINALNGKQEKLPIVGQFADKINF